MLGTKSKDKKFKKIRYEYFGLIDSHTARLLILDTSFQNINLLREITTNTVMIHVPTRNFLERLTYSLLGPGTFHFMRWRVVSSALEISSEDKEAFRSKSALIVAKYRTLCLIIERISNLRIKLKKDILLQEAAYLKKATEAQRFKDREYPEHEILEYPFLLQYADYLKIPLREATDRILLKSRIVNEALAKTETLRIKYFNAIKDVEAREELGKVYRNFLLDYDIKL